MNISELAEKIVGGKSVDTGKKDEKNFVDLESRPVTATDIQAINEKLKNSGKRALWASAAWWKKGDKEVQRIWYVEFSSEAELEKYLKEREEAEKRDHRFIGRQLDLFHIEEDIVGPGLPLMHPKGTVIRNQLIQLIKDYNNKMGFQEVWSPHVSKAVLWKMSGHYDHYKDSMFMWTDDAGDEWGLKAMNCPLHIQIYKFLPRSYRELPIRYAEFATDYRKEQSGELHGLARVMSLTQDDHHVFALPEQIEHEVSQLAKTAMEIFEMLGMPYKIKLSTKPEKAMGDKKIWDKAEQALNQALENMKVEFEVKQGEGAFYGPKIDFDVRDALGRWWQLTTIQLDFNLPERFQLSYTDSDGELKRPIQIHSAILGSIERFMAPLIEHFAGRFPVWLAPVQLRILPVSHESSKYAQNLFQELKKAGYRVEVEEEETLSYRIRKAETDKLPLIVIVGEKEASSDKVSVRIGGKNKTELIAKKQLMARLEKAVSERTLTF